MTFTNVEKYVYSKKCLKQRRQPPYPSLMPPSIKVEGQEPAKVFSRRKSHLATAVIKGLNGLFSHSYEGTEEQQWRKVRYRVSFLLPQLFHFLVEIALPGKSK